MPHLTPIQSEFSSLSRFRSLNLDAQLPLVVCPSVDYPGYLCRAPNCPSVDCLDYSD